MKFCLFPIWDVGLQTSAELGVILNCDIVGFVLMIHTNHVEHFRADQLASTVGSPAWEADTFLLLQWCHQLCHQWKKAHH